MLACLPVPGDLPTLLLPYPQMSTGLQKWDTTQKMRGAQHPTPAELDTYAKKVADHPLTIKIFPNSVKVPQRKHVRRTVNGLDTSGPRYAPYPPSPAPPKAGLLAIVRCPAGKGPPVKDFDGTRRRLRPEATMNPPSAPYPAGPSTLSHAQQQQQAAALAHQQALHQALGPHPPPGGPHPPLQGPPQPQPPPHPGNHLLQPPLPLPPPPGPGAPHGGRKLAEADAPPNVTVSTSTIPLSLAAALQQHPPADLSTIVHQINQFCQARAGAGATSVCEGQIANPSPISRNLLISASSRVSAHHGPAAPLPVCLQQAHAGDHAGAPVGAMPLGNAAGQGPSAYPGDMKQQQQQAAAAAWNQHQLAHLQRMCGAEAVGHPGRMGKGPGGGRELPGPAFLGGKGYGLELCAAGQPFSIKPPLEKPTPSPPVNGLPPGPHPYANGPYFQPLWNNLLPTPNSDSSGSQDLAMPFHAASVAAGGQQQQQPPPPMECTGGPPPYRGGGPSGPGSLMASMEYLGGDLPASCLQEQGRGLLGKAPHPSMNREPGMDVRSLHVHHPGYR